jgi:hypothetical protein
VREFVNRFRIGERLGESKDLRRRNKSRPLTIYIVAVSPNMPEGWPSLVRLVFVPAHVGYFFFSANA